MTDIWEALRSDLNMQGQTIKELALATDLSEQEVQAIVDDEPDIAWTGERDGQDLYVSVAHLDPEGWTEW